MTDKQMVRGTNFTCFHAGPKEGWTPYRLDPPDVPLPAEVNLFLRNFLGAAKVMRAEAIVGDGECDVKDDEGDLVAGASSTCMKLRESPPTER
jgi:hypothetical protein